MPATATERWTGVSYTPGVSALRAFDVPAEDAEQALAAVPIVAGSTHPKDATLTASAPEAVTNGGPRNFIVSVRYSPASIDAAQKEKLKPRIQWWLSTSREQWDIDAKQRPIVNSAGDAFDPPLERDQNDRGFSIFRYETTYDLELAETYDQAVNDSDVVLLGRYKFKRGQLKVDSYIPLGQLPFDIGLFEVEYRFAFRRDGWNYRAVDQGLTSWGVDSASGKLVKMPIVYADTGEQVTEAVKLNGLGAPVDSASFKVMSRRGVIDAANNPTPPDPAIVERVANTGTYFIRYQRYNELPYVRLTL